MKHRIELSPEIRLIGMSTRMSMAQNQTQGLWKRFMPRLKEVSQVVDADLYSVEVYEPSFFTKFDPNALFDKWSAVAVAAVAEVPEGMQSITISSGMYAVFLYIGPASEGGKAYRYIFETWLPSSGYVLDDRPHFAKMGTQYLGENPQSEEEIWVPVRKG